ncbi:hypothetical protein B0E51_14735 [Rhodanobacter sp. C05]|nr:hypothetical protein B0E51_14735 [Rhodanobacter sp. C05]
MWMRWNTGQAAADRYMAPRHRLVFVTGLYLAYLIALYGLVGIHGDSIGESLVRLVTPLIELGLFYSFTEWLDGRWPGRIASALVLLIAAIVSAIYAVQIYALYLSGNFITVLAIENRTESRIVAQRSLYLALLIAVVWWLIHATACLRARRAPRPTSSGLLPTQRSRNWLLPLTLALLLVQACLVPWQGSTSLLEVGYRQAPIGSLVSNYGKVLRSNLMLPSSRQTDSAGEAATFPLEKREVYSTPLSFASTDNDATIKNVIVIFTEGTSARLIGAYGGQYPNLTPNIDRLAARSMRVTHYYNHTAATYRGIQGQLVSGYPWAGGGGDTDAWENSNLRSSMVSTNYRSVPMTLRDLGYRTNFLSPHHDTVELNTMLRMLGFDKVFSFDDVSRDIAPGNPMYTVEGALSDGELFHALNLLLQRHTLSGASQPFFTGVYNFGTHAFLDVVAFGLKYGDGSNPSLNKLHNYDHAVGTFLDYFFASEYAKNTILIFTADHATYPDPAYRQVAGKDYQPYFVDQIPLLIYDPFHRLPATYDANGRTSIDLAPTLLQLLGVRRVDNSFLGTSLFEDNHQPIGFSAIGREFYATDAHGVYPEGSIPATYLKPFTDDKAAVEDYYRLEKANRIFEPLH